MADKIATSPVNEPLTSVDVACVIHSTGYDWVYVDRLYNMVRRNLSCPVRFHVYTELERSIPEHMIKHALPDLGLAGPRQSWWYKIHLFNLEYHRGPILYLDLDVVVANRLDWILSLPLGYFWGIRDFKHIWKPTTTALNSSVMWFDTRLYSHVYQSFADKNLRQLTQQYKGDQDFIDATLAAGDKRYFDIQRIKSWRWQVLDGGFNFKTRNHHNPGTGPTIDEYTSVIVFHGHPKPHQVVDPTIQRLWI